jgi:hypothetical protein
VSAERTNLPAVVDAASSNKLLAMHRAILLAGGGDADRAWHGLARLALGLWVG